MKYHPRMLVIVVIIGALGTGVWALTARLQLPQTQELMVPAVVTKSGRPRNAAAEQRHLLVAQQLAPVVERSSTSTAFVPTVTAIDSDGGVTTFVTVPLVWDSSKSAQAQVEQSKEQLAAVLNKLFASDPALERVGIVATYPRADGREVPAMYVVMPQSAWRTAGSLSGATLATTAQSFKVAAALTQ